MILRLSDHPNLGNPQNHDDYNAQEEYNALKKQGAGEQQRTVVSFNDIHTYIHTYTHTYIRFDSHAHLISPSFCVHVAHAHSFSISLVTSLWETHTRTLSLFLSHTRAHTLSLPLSRVGVRGCVATSLSISPSRALSLALALAMPGRHTNAYAPACTRVSVAALTHKGKKQGCFVARKFAAR